MIKSMTAYARTEHSHDDITVSIEMRTYNSRHLDPMVRVPGGLGGLEERIKSCIAKTLVRGRVEVRLHMTDTGEAACGFEADLVKAAAYIDAARQIQDTFSLSGQLDLSLVMQAGGMVKPQDNPVDLDRIWAAALPALEAALAAVDEMRTTEGAYLANDFRERLDWIEAKVAAIDAASGELLPVYQEKLVERVRTLTKDAVEIDPARLAQEAALMADRSDISEEVVRAGSHVAQFRSIMDGPEAGGRKLNFLLQEFNREFNTMGSKAANTEIAHTVVAVKAELEKLREQVQNVE